MNQSQKISELSDSSMLKKRILISTYSLGGPKTWAEGLSRKLTKQYDVELLIGRRGYLQAMFSRCAVIHSTVALPFTLAKKFVLTIHGDFRKEKLLGRIFFPIAIKLANTVTVPSEYIRDQLKLTDVIVIPNGVGYPDKPKTVYRQLEKHPVIGILTSFHFREKAEGVLTLAGFINQISPKSQFLVGGDGKFLQVYEQNIRSILPHTQFLGHCKKEELFSRIDLFAYYSFFDNQPIALLEAMAYGLPVLSNRFGAVGEVLTGAMAKYLADTRDEYKTILSKLISSEKERRTCGHSARIAAAQFSWEHIAEKFIGIYENKNACP